MESLCRVCRNPVGSATDGGGGGGGINISDISQRCGRPIWQMMYQCTHIEITPNDLLPKRLCMSCAERLDIAFEFLDMCYASLSYFNSCIEAHEQKPTLAQTCKPLSGSDCRADTIQISEVRSEIEEANVHSHQSSSYSSCSTFELEEQKPNIACLQNANSDPLIEPLSVCTVQEDTSSNCKNYQSDYEQYQAVKEKNRLRTAWRRANRSEEETNRERELNRLRAAAKRANFTEEEKKRFNEYHRLRIASRRARQTPEQKEAERESNRQKIQSQQPTLVQTETSKPSPSPDFHQDTSEMCQTPEHQNHGIYDQQNCSYSSSFTFEPEDQKPNIDCLQNTNSDLLIEPLSVCTVQEDTSSDYKHYQSDYEQCQTMKEKNRLRIASKRASRSEEETDRERELNRLRAAAKRANFTEEEKKRFNEYHRMRQASRRARQTPEQKEAERERNRQKIAQRRALLRHHTLNLAGRMEDSNKEESFS